MTQKSRVLKMLKDAGSEGVRSDEFYREFLGRGVARIYDLRRDGHNITDEREGKYKRYKLVGVGAGQGSDLPQAELDQKVSANGNKASVNSGESRLFPLPSQNAFTDAEAA
jgi:hypothetical protein